MEKKVVIIGSGPTGLGAAVRLNQIGHKNWTVLEQTAIPGGLARSVTDSKGFIWDMGGHVIFSHYKYFDQLLNKCVSEWNDHHRESWVWCLDRFVPYPFQNNIHRLPSEKMLDCLNGIIAVKADAAIQAKKPATFQDWIDKNFGTGLGDIFLNPYNYKVWAFRPKDMSAQWMGERVPMIDVGRIVKNVTLNEDDVGWGPNATFRFPVHEGTGGIWKNVAASLPQDRIKYGSKVQCVDAERKVVIMEDGTEEPYDVLLSTMPLDLLLRDMKGNGDAISSVKSNYTNLIHSSSHIVGIGLKGQPPAHLAGKCWMYFPEDDCPFYRATLFSHYSSKNVPDSTKQWSLMFEVSESTDRAAPDDLIEATIVGALNTKLFASRDEIVSTWHERLEHGYPTPYVGRDEYLAEVQPKLMNLNIWSRGRFGGWKYEVGNQDHSLMQGVEAADSMLFGVEESTYFYPDLVNSRPAAKTQRSYDTL